ncbi:MAG TPA: HAMP domain-containing sensor histidine kinase [Baekduia sp.]|nr:HAMP domain-containing sensor histidine kinase [Baekduia sp.]
MPRAPALFSSLPVRVRVTLAFAAAMSVLLACAGLLLYVELGRTLNATVDRGLRSRAGDVATLVQQVDTGFAQSRRSPLTEQGESFAQLLDTRGRVVDAPPALRRRSLLTADQLRRARRGTIFVERTTPFGESDRVRLLATPVTAQHRRLVVVVGASLDATAEARDRLGRLLLLGGPIALLIASLAGYGAAAGALRPVESMRRRAQQIQASRPGRRLPVPSTGDEVARLGETLNDMLERLEAAMARERQFVSDASHELRTPLAIIKAELELALRDADDVETFRQAVQSAAEEADRVVQLAEDLLVIARSERGRLPLRADDADVGALLQVVARRFARRAAEHGVELTVEVPEGLRLVGDRLRLEQAVGNLIDNALRHGAGTIRLRAEPTTTGVELHVLDDGDGLPPAFVPAAFDRFTRADAGRTTGGAGLGLAIVDAIARAHDGTAGVRNRPEGGADVWLSVPRQRSDGRSPA